MSPNQLVRFYRRLKIKKSLGASLIACVFSFIFSSCASSNSSSGIITDKFLGDLQIKKEFGNFINAQAMSIDAFGNIYVVDAGAPGVYKFNSNGDSIRGVIGFGKEHNQFDDPRDVDASLTNSIAIADRNNHRIEIYSKDLIWQSTITGHESGAKIQFGYPSTIRLSSAGNYYLIDGENKRALRIQPENNSQKIITTSGTESGAEMSPLDLAVSDNEYITIVDRNSSSLITFNNALLAQKRIMYNGIQNIKLLSANNLLYVMDKNENVIRIVEAFTMNRLDDISCYLIINASLAYIGSYKLPHFANQFTAFSVYKDAYYLLTKEKVIVCSKD
jgi:hypothetical protein